MKKIFLVLLSFLLFTGVAYASGNFWPWNLRLGSPWALDLANVEYTGINRAIPDSMQYGAELEFDGVGTYVDTAAVLSDGDDYTLCVTAERPNTLTTTSKFVGFADTTNQISSNSNYYLDVLVWDANQASYVRWRNTFSSLGIDKGTTFRVAVSVPNGGTPHAYVNGVDLGIAQTNPTANIATAYLSAKVFIIGAINTAPDEVHEGTIANAQIWNHAFTADDVTYDYANQLTTADTRTGTDLVRANLVGHWKLDEQWGTVAEDSSDGGNPGALVGFGDREYPRLRDIGKSPKDNAVVYSGQMLDFDGSDDYVDCGYNIGTLDGNFTIKLAIKPDDYSTQYALGTYYTGDKLFALRIDNTEALTFRAENECAAFINSAIPVTHGEYNHITIIREGRGFKGYNNGILVTEYADYFNADAEFIFTDTYRCLIGKHSAGYPFNGFIGNVQIWDAAMTADDVAFDYANPELPAHNRPGTSLTAANLKGWWPLIEGSGDTAYDWSGNGNHGTLEGFTHPGCWDDASGGSSPFQFQTAYADWGMGVNTLTTTDLENAYWEDSDVDRDNGYTAPNGTSTAFKISEDGGGDSVFFKSTVCVAGDQRSIWARTVSGTGIVDILNHNTDSRQPVTLTESWQRFECNYDEVTVGQTYFYAVDFRGADSNLTEVLLWNPQNEPATTASATTITHATPATNALTPIRSWETANQFTSPLNWNGRGYADCGNGVDVNPSTALIIEGVLKVGVVPSATKSILWGKQYALKVKDSGNLECTITNSASEANYSNLTSMTGSLKHFIFAFSASGQFLKGYANGVLGDTDTYSTQDNILPDADSLNLSSIYGTVAQLPLFRMLTDASAQKIIDKDLDAWVAKRYAKVCKKYDL